MRRLVNTDGLPDSVDIPGFDRDAASTGILHLGIGGFHRAHQAVYTDDAMAAAGGNWMIEGVSLRHPDMAAKLNPQNGLFSVTERDSESVSVRVIGSVRCVHVGPENPETVLARLADPDIRIVSLTVTEKAYGFSGPQRRLDPEHPAMVADLAKPEFPVGPVGFLVEGLARRHRDGIKPFTPLCCDNIPANGAVLKRLVVELAQSRDAGLAQWIETEVPFPSTMVDRIVPATDEATLRQSEQMLGKRDEAAIATEPFRQWVIEDSFADGRPAWEAGGALFVSDVAPYEQMKLRMLNGAHSLLAWLGFGAGFKTVLEAMQYAPLAAIVRHHMSQAARSLPAAPAGINLNAYADDLCARFRNPGIAYATHQIASDSSQKLPQRILEPASDALAAGLPIETYALAVAGFMRYATGRHEDGTEYDLRDPSAKDVASVARSAGHDADLLADRLFAHGNLFPPALTGSKQFVEAVKRHLRIMQLQNMRSAIDAFELPAV